MKIGDKVKYIVGGKEHTARIVWLMVDGIDAVVETTNGTRDRIPRKELTVIN